MAGVDEKEISERREQMAVGGILSAQAIESHEAALAHLKSKGFSHDYASEQLHLLGADAVLAAKAAEEAPVEAPVEAPAPVEPEAPMPVLTPEPVPVVEAPEEPDAPVPVAESKEPDAAQS